MPEIEDIAYKISLAFEDNYFIAAKRNAFNAVFNKYLSLSDPNAEMEPYEAIVALGYKHRPEFDVMVKELKETGLIEG
ncbi:MAG TPA: hypothetical protein DHV16_09525 [Nitrospiraceae bacterium]|nr:MAG: hypothetical protein A2Z82_07145 [Nitrospirae bacterium GWA2_46_11]OGW23770.1 MAG: hypothetical protein A2X55_10645 [Nitrospirae bacterium GWB2_47_37]HAK89367.1 hypothetical protein [Nitrospiraceae bacterium]HCL81337.1 hypothetical protein [Nitrospiraceae bacterium]HCZ12469.1 hypothetical protein [Nitrospiraceae bacterium]